MASHDLDHQKANGESLITELKELRQQVQQLRTAQKQGADVITVSFGGPYDQSVVVGAPGIQYFTLSAVADIGETRPVFASAGFTFWEDAIDDAHEVGYAVANAFSEHWRIWPREDQKRSTRTKQTWMVDVVNLDSLAHTLYMRVNIRWAITR